MVRKFLLIFLVFISFPAQSKIADTEVSWSEFSAPVTTRASYILWSGLGLAIYLKQGLPDFVESTQRTWNQEKPLGDYSKYGDLMGQGIPNALYFFGMLGHYYYVKTEKSKERAVYMLKSTLYSVTATQVLKFTWREPRPDNPDSLDSFPSGHTTSAFSFASVVGVEHGPWWGAGAYALATFVGLSRLNDNRHRLNDIIAGAAIGTSYGLGLYYHYNPDKSERVTVLPFDDGVFVTANLSWPE